MAEPIRVLVVDDCEPIRIGIRRAFARANRGGGGIQIIGETGDGAGALALLESLNPQVVLLDGRLPDLCGYEIIERARERNSDARFIAYSAYEEYEDVMNLLRAGASGFVVKDEATENLLHAVRTVARGGTWYSQRIAQKLGEWAQKPPSPHQLTESQVRVLRLVARAQSDDEIMAELGISARMLRHHLRNLMDRAGVTTRAQLLLWALEQGFGAKRLREERGDYTTPR